MRHRRPLAALLALVAALNAGCATTLVMITPYDDRRPEQYRLLWVDAVVVGVATAVGAPLYATGEPGSTEESVGAGLLIGAGVWAAWTLVFGAMLRMPDRPRPRYRGALSPGALRRPSR